MPAMEIARRDDDPAVAVAESKRRLRELAATGDVEALQGIAVDAGAANVLLRKRGYDAEANAVMRLKIEAEAEIGILWKDGAPVDFANRAQQDRMCGFAIGVERGVLSEILDEPEDITMAWVRSTLQARGYYAVPVASTAAALEAWAAAKGAKWRRGRGGRPGGCITISATARDFGVHPNTLGKALGHRENQRVKWEVAKQIADAIGVDALAFPPAPSSMRIQRRRNRWLKRQLKPSGGRWDECYSRLRKTLDEFQRLAPNQDVRWDEAYSHFYALNAAIESAVRNDG